MALLLQQQQYLHYSLTCIRPDDDGVRVRFPRRRVAFIIPILRFYGGISNYFLLHDDVYYLRVRESIQSLQLETQCARLARVLLCSILLLYILLHYSKSRSKSPAGPVNRFLAIAPADRPGLPTYTFSRRQIQGQRGMVGRQRQQRVQ